MAFAKCDLQDAIAKDYANCRATAKRKMLVVATTTAFANNLSCDYTRWCIQVWWNLTMNLKARLFPTSYSFSSVGKVWQKLMKIDEDNGKFLQTFGSTRPRELFEAMGTISGAQPLCRGSSAPTLPQDNSFCASLVLWHGIFLDWWLSSKTTK